MSRKIALLILVLALSGLAAPAQTAAAPAAPATATVAVPAHPRLLLTPVDVERLRLVAQSRQVTWRRLITWGQAPARQEHAPLDGPGLALAALMGKDSQPEQAKRLGRLAVSCAQAAALTGRAQSVHKNSLNDTHRPGSLEKLKAHPHNLLNTATVHERPWRVVNQNATSLATNPADPPLDSALKDGEGYILLTDDLERAGELVGAVALTLDWAWDFFTPQERQDVAAWLVGQAKAFDGQAFSGFSDQAAQLLRLKALAGLAAQGLHPQAEALAQQARQEVFAKQILPCLQGAGAGGAWFEGSGGGALAGLNLVEFAAAWKSATGEDLMDSAPWFQDRLGYLLNHQLPGTATSPRGAYRLLAPDGDQDLNPQEASDLVRMQMLCLLALKPQAHFAGWAWVELMDRSTPRFLADSRLVYEFLWYNPDPAVKPLSTAPLTYLAPGAGRAFLRSDWSPLATWLSFNCGPHFALHQHLDAGSLVIYRQGFLLPPGGVFDAAVSQHAQNYAIRSLAHNTVQVLDPQEYSWLDLRDGPQRRGTYANDGGQRAWELYDAQGQVSKQAPWTASGWDSGPAPYSQLKDVYQVAQVEALEDKPRFAYVRGQATRAYDGSTHKVSRLVRHIIYLRPGGTDDSESQEAVVVADDVVLNNEQASVRFVLHSASAPQVTGSVSNLGPGRTQAASQRLRILEGPSRLDVVCLLPDKAQIRTYGQAGLADSWVGDRNYPPRPPAKNPAPFRVEIGAAEARGKDRVMLNVLLPADAGSGEPVPVSALPIAQAGLVGVMLGDRTWPRVVVLRLGDPQAEAAIAYQYPGGASRHLVAGLVPGQTYQVAVSGGKVSLKTGSGPGEPLQASAAGTLAFKVPGPRAEVSAK
ncbi:MAG: hypothetical protein V1806_17635 [Pseudomonadota bacterium]